LNVMEHPTSSGAVNFPVGGQEEHVFIWITPGRADRAWPQPSDPLELYEEGSLENIPNEFSIGFSSWREEAREEELLSQAIEDQCYAEGGFVKRLTKPSDFEQTRAIFNSTGDCLSVEGAGLNHLICDLATGERVEPSFMVNSSSKLKGILGRALTRIDEDSKGFFVTTHPGSIPRFGHREPFRLFRHINIYSPVQLDDTEMDEFSSALVSLITLLGSGGLGPSGFCVSPTAAATVTRRVRRNWFAPPYIVAEKICDVLSAPPNVEARMHVALDPACTPMGSALGFFCVQLLYSMFINNCAPLGGKRLSNPARAAHTWASRPGTRCALAGGGKTNAWDLAREFRMNLERFRKEVRMSGEHEALADLLDRGIQAATAGEKEDGFLATHFEYYRKRDLYERVLRENFGITIERFNTLCRTLFHAGIPPYWLEQMSIASIAKNISKKSPSSRARFEAFMKRSKLTNDDLRAAASCFRKMEQLELSLGVVHPNPDGQIFPDAEKMWRQFTGEHSQTTPTATRADARARLVSYAKFLEVDPNGIALDWANSYCWPGNDDMLEVIVSPMGTPDSPRTAAEMVHLKFRESDIEFIMEEVPSALPFRDALREEMFCLRSSEARRKRRRDEGAQMKLFDAYRGLRD